MRWTIGVNRDLLPEIKSAHSVAGHLLPEAAALLGLRAGTSVLTGIVDGGVGMLFAGATHGKIFNVSGFTDVLAFAQSIRSPTPAAMRGLGLLVPTED